MKEREVVYLLLYWSTISCVGQQLLMMWIAGRRGESCLVNFPAIAIANMSTTLMPVESIYSSYLCAQCTCSPIILKIMPANHFTPNHKLIHKGTPH